MNLLRELEMHQQRAREIRTQLGLSKPAEPWFEILECQAGSLRVALPLSDVLRAELAVKLSPLPDAPSWMAGQLNWHTQTVPIIDLALRLGESGPDMNPSDRIVICSCKDKLIGFLVQTIFGPLRTPTHDISEPHHEIPYKNYLIGSLSHDDEIVYIVGTEAMLAFADI